jgi:hypothetical protein
MYISQLSDESIYHRKPIKDKPIAPEKPQVVPQQPARIIIAENKNMNKDVNNFDTKNTTTPKPTKKKKIMSLSATTRIQVKLLKARAISQDRIIIKRIS